MRNDKLLENAYSQKHIKMACKYNAAAWPCWNKPSWLFVARVCIAFQKHKGAFNTANALFEWI